MSKFKKEKLRSGYDVLFASIGEQIERHGSGAITWEEFRRELIFLSEHHHAAITLRVGPDPWPLRFDGARLNVPPVVKVIVEKDQEVRIYSLTEAA